MLKASLLLSLLVLVLILPVSLAGQQSAEAADVLTLEKDTPRGPKTYLIEEGKSVVGIKAKGQPVVMGRVIDITDSTIIVGRHTIPLAKIEHFQGNLGRRRLNLLMILLPTSLFFFCLIFGGFFLAVEIFGLWWLTNTGPTAFFFLLGVFGIYGLIPFFALWLDAVVRFFSKLTMPNPWHFKNNRIPTEKGVKS